MDLAQQLEEFRSALEANAATYELSLTAGALEGLSKYYELLTVWNSRLHLVAPTAPREFATRHILESLILLKHLPRDARIADIGSGAGLPIIPCLAVRPDLRATMIEASPKKAVFLREAVGAVLNHKGQASVVAERFENVPTPEVGFITCRALENFTAMIPKMLEWAPGDAKLLLFGGEGLGKSMEDAGCVASVILIPNSQRRFLFVIDKATGA